MALYATGNVRWLLLGNHAVALPFRAGRRSTAGAIRQFLLRGLPKVQTEWRWAATAFNLAEIVRETARLRAQFAKAIMQTEGWGKRRLTPFWQDGNRHGPRRFAHAADPASL